MFTRKLTAVLLFCAVLTGWFASAWLQGPRPVQAETAYAELQLFTDVGDVSGFHLHLGGVLQIQDVADPVIHGQTTMAPK